MRARGGNQWRRSLWTVGAIVLVGALGLVWLTRDDGQASEPSPPEATSLEEAALERFAHSRPRIELPSGREILPQTDAQERAMKIRLFKSSLAREIERDDPSFRGRAEKGVAARRPREVILQWEDLTGNQQMRTVVADTRDCGVDFESSPAISVPLGQVRALPCIDLHDGVPPWEHAIGDITILTEPIEPGTRQWKVLVHERMKSMAAAEFEARANAE